MTTTYAYSVHNKILSQSLSGTQQGYSANTFTKTAKQGLKPSTHNRYSMAGNWALQHFTEAEWKTLLQI